MLPYIFMKTKAWNTWHALFRAVIRRFLSWLITLAACSCFVVFFHLYCLLCCIRHGFIFSLLKRHLRANLHSGCPVWCATGLWLPTSTPGSVFLGLLFSFPACSSHFFSCAVCLRGVALLAISVTPFQSILSPSLFSEACQVSSFWVEPGLKGRQSLACHLHVSLLVVFSLFPHLNPSVIFYGHRGTAFRQASGL